MPSLEIKNLPASAVVCDAAGVILEMNGVACRFFAKDGGGDLVGKNVLDCHPEPARAKLADILKRRTVNCYTVEKNGRKRLVYQSPWYQDGEYGGLVELIIDLPENLEHKIR